MFRLFSIRVAIPKISRAVLSRSMATAPTRLLAKLLPTTKIKPLPTGTLAATNTVLFPKTEYPASLAVGQMQNGINQVLRERGQQVLAERILALLAPSIAHLSADAGTASYERGKEPIFVTPEVVDSGHFGVNIQRLPLANREVYVADLNAMRYVGAGFPGGMAAITPDQRVRLFTPDRGSDGDDVALLKRTDIQRNWPDIAHYNGSLFRDGKPVQGDQMLTINSIINVQQDGHFVVDINGVKIQIMIAETSPLHRFQGASIWFGIAHPDHPDHLLCGNIGVGEHALKLFSNFADTCNGAAAPFLFEVANQRGLILYAMKDEIIKNVGIEKFSQLSLNSEVAIAHRNRVSEVAAHLNYKASMLSFGDNIAGLLTWFNYHSPSSPVVIDIENPPATDDPEALAEIIKAGADLYTKDNGKADGAYIELMDAVNEAGGITPPADDPTRPVQPVDPSHDDHGHDQGDMNKDREAQERKRQEEERKREEEERKRQEETRAEEERQREADARAHDYPK